MRFSRLGLADRRGRSIVTLALAVVLTSCAGTTTPCANEPAGSATVFFAGGEASRDVIAAIDRVTPLPDIGGFRYDLSDSTQLTWIASFPLPLTTGATYRLVVDYAAGSPDASGILAFQDDALVFAAATDQVLFSHVLKSGIPGFEVTVADSECRSRGRTRCHEALVNQTLVVEHAGERATLHHGETVRIGAFDVRALTVQRVTYAKRCADAGLPAVSFAILRAK